MCNFHSITTFVFCQIQGLIHARQQQFIIQIVREPSDTAACGNPDLISGGKRDLHLLNTLSDALRYLFCVFERAIYKHQDKFFSTVAKCKV